MKLLALSAAALAALLAQSPGVRFDAASIKLHPEPINISSDPKIRGRRVVGTASTLLDLITCAYAKRYDQISGGPAWAASEHYDLNAVAEGQGVLTDAEYRQALRTLLAERFHLAVHFETKEVPMYALTVSRHGSKLKPPVDDRIGGVRGDTRGMHMEVHKGTMQWLADQLSGSSGRPVLDRTGLTGEYFYVLDWFPTGREREPGIDTPDLFAALEEQLGLTLEPARGPTEKLIIDRAEKPSEN